MSACSGWISSSWRCGVLKRVLRRSSRRSCSGVVFFIGASSETHRGRSPRQRAGEDAPCPTTVRSASQKDPHESHKRLKQCAPVTLRPGEVGAGGVEPPPLGPKPSVCTLLPWGAGLVAPGRRPWPPRPVLVQKARTSCTSGHNSCALPLSYRPVSGPGGIRTLNLQLRKLSVCTLLPSGTGKLL